MPTYTKQQQRSGMVVGARGREEVARCRFVYQARGGEGRRRKPFGKEGGPYQENFIQIQVLYQVAKLYFSTPDQGVRRGPPGAGGCRARTEVEVGSAAGRRGSDPLGALHWGQTWTLPLGGTCTTWSGHLGAWGLGPLGHQAPPPVVPAG